MATLKGGTTIGGYLVYHQGNLDTYTKTETSSLLGAIKIDELKSTYPASVGQSIIPIGLAGYDATRDILFVYQDNILLYEGTHYAKVGSSITLLSHVADAKSVFHFHRVRLLK